MQFSLAIVLNFLLCAANGLMYYDIEEGGGFGAAVEKGDSVTVSPYIYTARSVVLANTGPVSA